MLFFAGSGGNVLVTTSGLLARKTTLSIPLLDMDIRVLVLTARFEPRPSMQIQSTVGGSSFLRVMGEEPPVMTITGLITGSTNCANIQLVNSAMHSGVDFFVQNSVVQNTLPVKYTLGQGSTIRDAYIIGMSLDAQESFSDVIQFTLSLISEPVIRIKDPATFAGQVDTNVGDNNLQVAASSFLSKVSPTSLTSRQTPVNSLLSRAFAPTVSPITSPLGKTARNAAGELRTTNSLRGIVLQSRTD